ncbi:MAG: hypothetical protein IPN17_01280 [Deltaproteobacteria bacterium]|nr:hypothetical protein [Deltaproteobacteria bacterium]
MDDGVNPFWAAPQEAAAELRVVVRYVVPSDLPLWLDDHRDVLGRLSVSRATGGTVFNVNDDDWSAVVALAGGWPEVLPPPTAPPVGKVYVNVGRVSRAAARDPFEVDPDKVDRGNQAHARTVDALADHLRARDIVPKVPTGADPEFDRAWEDNGVLYVAEIKSVTDENQEKQLRLGLGQVLRYRHLLGGRRSKNRCGAGCGAQAERPVVGHDLRGGRRRAVVAGEVRRPRGRRARDDVAPLGVVATAAISPRYAFTVAQGIQHRVRLDTLTWRLVLGSKGHQSSGCRRPSRSAAF